jgi:hypothetical protein
MTLHVLPELPIDSGQMAFLCIVSPQNGFGTTFRFSLLIVSSLNHVFANITVYCDMTPFVDIIVSKEIAASNFRMP